MPPSPAPPVLGPRGEGAGSNKHAGVAVFVRPGVNADSGVRHTTDALRGVGGAGAAGDLRQPLRISSGAARPGCAGVPPTQATLPPAQRLRPCGMRAHPSCPRANPPLYSGKATSHFPSHTDSWTGTTAPTPTLPRAPHYPRLLFLCPLPSLWKAVGTPHTTLGLGNWAFRPALPLPGPPTQQMGMAISLLNSTCLSWRQPDCKNTFTAGFLLDGCRAWIWTWLLGSGWFRLTWIR